MAIQLDVSAPYQFININAFVKYWQRQHKLANNIKYVTYNLCLNGSGILQHGGRRTAWCNTLDKKH